MSRLTLIFNAKVNLQKRGMYIFTIQVLRYVHLPDLVSFSLLLVLSVSLLALPSPRALHASALELSPSSSLCPPALRAVGSAYLCLFPILAIGAESLAVVLMKTAENKRHVATMLRSTFHARLLTFESNITVSPDLL